MKFQQTADFFFTFRLDAITNGFLNSPSGNITILQVHVFPRGEHRYLKAQHALQGHSEEELPERLLGSVRLNHLDLRAARELDTSVEVPAAQRPVPNGFFEDSRRSLSVSVPASASGSAPASRSMTPTPSAQGVVKA